MALVLAICGLLCAAFNDLLFKVCAKRTPSYGRLLALIGTVWMLTALFLPRTAGWASLPTFFWGSVSGVFSIAANLLLLAAMKHESAGVCATIYRLNLVPAAIGAALLFGEHFPPAALAGLVCAAAAVLAFLPRGGRNVPRGLLLAALAALLRANMGLAYKCGLVSGADAGAIVLVNSFFWIGGGLLYGNLRERNMARFQPRLAGLGFVSGLLVCGICFFTTAALERGAAGVILPIMQMSFLGTFGLSALFLGERCTPRKIIAAVFGALAILLLARGT